MKEDFLSLSSLVEMDPKATAVNRPLGLATVPLETIEKWLFWGFLLCHQVVDMNKRESGEFRIWSLILQGMWVIDIFR